MTDLATSTRIGARDPATEGWDKATTVLAGGCVAAAGFNRVITPNISIALILAMGLSPLWLPVVGSFRLARAIVLLTAAALLWGEMLGRSAVDRTVDSGYAFITWTLVLSGLAGMLLVLWARTRMPLHRVVLLYGLGSLAGALSTGGRDWKFDLSVPVIFIFLGAVDRPDRKLPTALGLMALGAFSALNDGRSLLGFCAAAAAITIWQARPTTADAKRRPWRTGLMLALAGVVFYVLMSGLLTHGVLGSELRQRSEAQVEATGNLLLGGRPEWSANLQLMKERPNGYGLGVTADWRDLTIAREGFTSIRFDPGGYATYYMFGGAFALHAITADLWVIAGWVGIALALLMLWTLVSSLVSRLERREAPAYVSFAAVLGCWYLLFGPIYSNWLDVCIALGFVAAARWQGDQDLPPGSSHHDELDSAAP